MTDFEAEYGVRVGSELELLVNTTFPRANGGYGSVTLKAGPVTVTRVNTKTLWVRGPRSSAYNNERATVEVNVQRLSDPKVFTQIPLDPNAPKPRPIGEVPEGGISPSDPRLAWLWEDAAKVATRTGHCGEYDKICDSLGIPGRLRKFSVKGTLNGLEVSAKLEARSKKLAQEEFDRQLAGVSA